MRAGSATMLLGPPIVANTRSRMPNWTIAAVQMDCTLADKPRNLERIKTRLREAAGHGARLVIFPECALTGYCFESREEAWPFAETLPGASTESLTPLCR